METESEVVEVSAERIRSWVTQIADLRAALDRLAATARQQAPGLVPDVMRARDSAGVLGVQWQAVVRRRGQPDAEVRELHPREDKP